MDAWTKQRMAHMMNLFPKQYPITRPITVRIRHRKINRKWRIVNALNRVKP